MGRCVRRISACFAGRVAAFAQRRRASSAWQETVGAPLRKCCIAEFSMIPPKVHTPKAGCCRNRRAKIELGLGGVARRKLAASLSKEWVDAMKKSLLGSVDGTSWSGFTDHLGGIIIGRPSCTNVGLDHVQALYAVIGTDGSVFAIRFDGTSWGGFQALNGRSMSDPACTAA